MHNVLLIAFATTIMSGGLSDRTTWKADKSHSQVQFSVSHMGIAEVTGRFTEFDVTVVGSEDDFADATIEATIKTPSINTDNERRDGHLRSDDFLNVEKFPEMNFRSTSVKKTGKDTYAISGDLTIRDVTKSVVLDTRFKGTIKDTRGGKKAAFKAVTTINRFEFGTKWKGVLDTGGLIAGENVDITLLMELNQQQKEESNKQ